jgi:hypothetical protein
VHIHHRAFTHRTSSDRWLFLDGAGAGAKPSPALCMAGSAPHYLALCSARAGGGALAVFAVCMLGGARAVRAFHMFQASVPALLAGAAGALALNSMAHVHATHCTLRLQPPCLFCSSRQARLTR